MAPECNVARAALCGYFRSQHVERQQALFAWDEHGWLMSPEWADLTFNKKVNACYYRIAAP
eukprot:5988675-Prymnesium_polylepis.1